MADQNSLHDEIDQIEDYAAEAEKVVEGVRSRVEEIVAGQQDLHSMLEALAVEVENGLAEITTNAVRDGLAAGGKRTRAGRGQC